MPADAWLSRILSVLRVEPSPYLMIYELTLYMSNVVGADDVRVYALTPSHPSRVQRIVMGMSMVPHLVNIAADKAELLLKVAAGGSTVLETRPDNPDRYNLTSVRMLVDDDSDERYMMLQPVLGSDGKPAFVVEFNRKWQPFSTEDTNNSSHFLVWGSLLILWCDMYTSKNRTWDVTEFTLEVVKDIFEEMVAMTQVIKKILEAAQRLVNADRASLFLVDWRNKELISTVFDLRVEPGAEDKVEVTELRLPLDKGIVGHVATSGETMNIPDAYADARFNREIDEKTGYKTVSILCMPVKVKGKVFGIVQMVNKRNEEHFTHEDEVSFREFSTFFGLALHHAKLYEKIQRKEQKHKVALDVLKYHNTCKEDEVEELLKDDFEGSQPACDLTDFYLNPFKLNELAKCHRFLAMFDNLFDMGNFDKNTLAHFVLTVKKNYRAVPYHNFDHGWSVAHTMYCILTNDTLHRFNHNERLALFVSCLCHDLDHRGYTNKYMSEISSPLAAMYSTSTLEHHHFNITVMILQQDNHNILGNLTSEDYKEVLGYIRQCILATDLAAFFPNLEKMKELCAEKPKFDWENRIHRNLAMAISMTAADLSASCKPWEIQLKTVKVIVEEFYHQGDEEKRLGKTPVPMMDREKPNEQTESQIGFLSQICVPAYTILWKIMPRTIPLYFMVTRNLKAWQAIKARQMNEKSDNGGNSTLSDVPDISADSSSYNGDDTKGVCRYQSEKTKEEEMQAEERAEAARLDEACGGVDEVGGESVAETEARNLGQASDHVLDEQSWTDDDVVVASGNGDLLALLRELSTD
ncbi:probable 3',5'-cyclic phosphodiesterase pde-5 [Pectinophora gossypiella]|nr:probable 3',5'-cyclic phosphodiesterase pde-5 [Pectinophora gossypiella]